MADYQGKKVVIIGLGMTGLSCVDFFMARGVTPRVMDTRVAPPGLDKLPESVECHVGGLNDTWLLAADLVVASPGIALAHPSLSAAADAGVEIVGDIELFCREAQAPIIAITGSNGKSTVTTLVGEMAKAAGVNVEDFSELVAQERVRRLPIASRLYQKLSTRHRLAYVEAVNKLARTAPEFALMEYYYRCRLIQDYISGMTDLYAWDEYRRLMAVE